MGQKTEKKSLSMFFNAHGHSRKLGIEIYTLISLIFIVITNPWLNWLRLVDHGSLSQSLDLDSSVLLNGYNLFNLLNFVRISGKGILGIPAMLLLLIGAGAVILHLVTIINGLKTPANGRPLLNQLVLAQAAMLLSFFASTGSILFTIYANQNLETTVFIPGILSVLALILSVAGYVVVKMIQNEEQRINHDHGFFTELRKNWVLFLFLVPSFIFLVINNYLPMIGVYFAFTQFNFRDGLFSSPFIGFKNFEFLFKANLFNLTRNTILYNLVFIVVGNVLQIFFAILVSRVISKYVRKTTQTLIFMPYFVSYVILKVLVYNLFEYEYGIINSFLAGSGLDRIDFYNTPRYWPFIITIFYLWKSLGYGMVIYLATIMGISGEYYDSAKVDGANVVQEIMYITVPQLKPTFIILLLYALGSIMKGQFELFYQIIGNNGVLFNATDILDTYVYRITMTQPMSMGLGTAAGLFQSIFGFVVIVVTNFLIKRKNSEYALF